MPTLKAFFLLWASFREFGGFSTFQFWASFAILSPEVPAAMIAMLPVFVGSDHVKNLDDPDFGGITPNISTPSILDSFSAHSVVQEWDLRGSNSWVTEMFTSVYMSGMMSGAIGASQLADRFGRRKVHFLLILTMSTFGVLSALAPNPWLYAGLRFFAGLGVGGFYCIYSIYLMEFLTPSWRVICGSISFWFAGEMLLALLAYLIPSWRLLSLAAAIPAFLGLLTFPWMPETPRWLLCQGHTSQAEVVLGQIASWNGTQAPSRSAVNSLQKVISAEEESSGSGSTPALATLWTNFRSRLAIFLSLFFSLAFTYYGITFNAKNLSGNPSLNMAYMGLVDMVAFPMGSVFSNQLGRRRVTALFLSLASGTLVILMGLETGLGDDLGEGWVTGLSFLARFGVAGAWGVVVCFCQESFPTVVRSTALGLCCLMANTGGVLAPQIAFVGTVWPMFPHLVFTGIIITSAGMSWLLPEMKGKPLENF